MPQISFNFRWNNSQLIGVILILATFGAGAAFFVDYQLGPIDYFSPKVVEVDVPIGSSVIKIGITLEESGLIRNASYFTALTRLLGVEGKLKAGYYEFNTGMSVKQIVEKIVKGKVSTLKLTIPEGLTVKEMASLIEAKIGISTEEFLEAAREFNLDYTTKQDVEFQVEGFLFPDTYQIPIRVTAEDLLQIMVNRFKQVMGIKSVIVRDRSLSIWELITIASLIEEEAKLDGDRSLIAGVIYNRLDERMKLQLCASVLYVMEEKKERLSLKDTRIDSPYNTYQNAGLPPGPISNPGLKSLQAALNPEKSDYLFYFAMPDGTTYYSKTYNEHLRAIKKYLD
ncbi:MAG: endolytic transglycosylase MltG [Halanaerobiales bacterium]|nr:endolytic transglycosylase MltG [Halanaerobiales bacterium]